MEGLPYKRQLVGTRLHDGGGGGWRFGSVEEQDRSLSFQLARLLDAMCDKKRIISVVQVCPRLGRWFLEYRISRGCRSFSHPGCDPVDHRMALLVAGQARFEEQGGLAAAPSWAGGSGATGGL